MASVSREVTDIIARGLSNIKLERDRTEFISNSGYDLLDKLSRRRQYVRSHARRKVPLLGVETERSFVEYPDMEIAGYGLSIGSVFSNSNGEKTIHGSRSTSGFPQRKRQTNASQCKIDIIMTTAIEKPKRMASLGREEGLSFRQAVERMKRERLCKSETISKETSGSQKLPRISSEKARKPNLPTKEQCLSFQQLVKRMKKERQIRDYNYPEVSTVTGDRGDKSRTFSSESPRVNLPNTTQCLTLQDVILRLKQLKVKGENSDKDIIQQTESDVTRLMEKTSIDPRRARSLPWFEDSRTSYQHHADYLKRLANLRDELINQEQENLSNALERLKQRQNGKENRATNRPRDTDGYTFEVPQRKALLTTVEQFKRTRPRRSPPRIMPLEGKQIMEPQQFFKSPQSPPLLDKSAPTRSPDDSFKLNLQRLIQPTSSIPNIGRKSTTTNKQLVLESSPLQKKMTPPKLSPFHHIERTGPYKGTLKAGGRLKGLLKPDIDELDDLPPHSLQHSDTMDQDKMSLDQLKDYYCIYYLPTNTPVVPGEDDMSSYYGESVHSSRKSEKGSKKKVSVVQGRSMLKRLEKSRTPRRTPRRNRKFYAESYNYDSDYSGDTPPHAHKKQIVVDMPSIVFNSATPDRTKLDFDSQLTPLSKTYKQNELRQRELKNLIEDVKELNLRNDTLTGFLQKTPSE